MREREIVVEGEGGMGERARKRERGGREGEIVSDGFNTLVS